VARIDRVTCDLKTHETRQETAYIITSLTTEKASPECILGLNRGHWEIENRLHYVRDYTFDEDRCQIRKGSGPQVMASLRNLAIGVLRLAGHRNVAKAQRSLAARPHLAMASIGL
jgi:predicted transposase YbfD/YdcC